MQVTGQGGESGGDPGPDSGEALPPVVRHPLAVDEPLLEAAEGDVDGEIPDLRRVVHRGGSRATRRTPGEKASAGGRWPEPIGGRRVRENGGQMDSDGLARCSSHSTLVFRAQKLLLGSTQTMSSSQLFGPLNQARWSHQAQAQLKLA